MAATVAVGQNWPAPPPRTPGGTQRPHARNCTPSSRLSTYSGRWSRSGGIPGWQIALIAAAAALLAAVLAVIADRTWTARHQMADTA